MTRAYDNAVDARYPSGRRNLIINGAMEVAQRGTSFTATGYTLDRFDLNLSGGTATVTQETLTPGQTDIPSQFINYLRLAATAGNNYLGIRYKVENIRAVGEGKVTLSFYAKGTNPGGGSIYVQMDQNFGTGGSTGVTLTQQSFQVTSSWQRFTLTFDLPSMSGKTIDDSDSHVRFQIFQYTDASTDAWTLDITGVQLEYGNVATPFEHRSYGEELALCQRYYWRFDSDTVYNRFGLGENQSSSNSEAFINFPVPMRAIPSFSYGAS
jgi:hypothetical protein